MYHPLNRGLAALSTLAVSGYLILVGGWLVATRRIGPPGFGRILLARLRRGYAARLDGMRHQSGHCFVASVPGHLLSDRESTSRLRLYEDGRQLGPGHSTHEEIRRLGGGRFSHWGTDLLFSSSDNSDPSRNGRRYEVREAG
jgi:hypothetical protein